MGRSFVLELTSALPAPAAQVWRHASSMAGVNDELAPWVRMTHPPHLSVLDPSTAPLGQVAFHSWLLAFGLLPFDRHALRLLEVHEHDDGGGQFVEDSSSWVQRRWRHERAVRADGTGCTVTDRLEVEPRLPVTPVARRIAGALFRHRHRRLVRRFGAAAPSVPSRRDDRRQPRRGG